MDDAATHLNNLASTDGSARSAVAASAQADRPALAFTGDAAMKTEILEHKCEGLTTYSVRATGSDGDYVDFECVDYAGAVALAKAIDADAQDIVNTFNPYAQD